MPTKNAHIANLPGEYLDMSPEEVANILIEKPAKITNLFGEKIGTLLNAKLSNESMRPVVIDVLCKLIAPIQLVLKLREHTT